MRKYFALGIICSLLTISILLTSYSKVKIEPIAKPKYHQMVSSGGISGYSVAGCTCHGPANTAVGVTVTGLPPNPEVGITYPLQFVLTGTNPNAGFNLTVTNGTLVAGDASSQIISSTEIAHTAAKLLTAGQASFAFNWTPATTGATTFSYAGNNVDLTGGTGGDIWNLGTLMANVVLPVKIISFNAIAIKDNENYIQWQVAQESNIEKYEIEQSCDGVQFSRVGTVASNSQNSNRKSYNYTLNYTNCVNKSFYRLKIIELNGTYNYSSIVALQTNKVNTIQLLQNPINKNDGVIAIKVDKYKVKTAQLINEVGQVVQKYVGSNDKILQFDLPANIRPGIYTLVMQHTAGTKSLQVVVQ